MEKKTLYRIRVEVKQEDGSWKNAEVNEKLFDMKGFVVLGRLENGDALSLDAEMELYEIATILAANRKLRMAAIATSVVAPMIHDEDEPQEIDAEALIKNVQGMEKPRQRDGKRGWLGWKRKKRAP